MTYLQVELFASSILIAAVIGVFRIRSIDKMYLPFILLIWTAALNEMYGMFILNFRYSNSTVLNSNIYVLFESVLILWFFKRLKMVFKTNSIFYILVVSVILFWIIENLIWKNVAVDTSYYFRIYASFITVICSITTVNYLIVRERKSLIRAPVFLICIGFIVYFTYKVLLEAFELYGLSSSMSFEQHVYAILLYLNLFVNLLFALAILWIPRKRGYMLLS